MFSAKRRGWRFSIEVACAEDGCFLLFTRSLTSTNQPRLIARPHLRLDGLGARRRQASRFAAPGDLNGQTLQAWPSPLGVVLVNGLLDDGFGTGIQALLPGTTGRRQISGYLVALQMRSSQQGPNPSGADTERCRCGRHVSGCSRWLARQCREQIAPPPGLGPVGIAITQFIHRAQRRFDCHQGPRQSDLQRVDRHLVPCIGTEQHRLDAQNALHPPARARVFDQGPSVKVQQDSASH
jgi:hypothetical protein